MKKKCLIEKEKTKKTKQKQNIIPINSVLRGEVQ